MSILKFQAHKSFLQHRRICLSAVNFAQLAVSPPNSLASPKTNSVRLTRSHLKHQVKLLPTALKAFYAKNKHFAIPRNFTFPSLEVSGDGELHWPNDVCGLNLSQMVQYFLHTIHKNKEKPLQIEQIEKELYEIGFPLRATNFAALHWIEIWEPAIQTYYKLHGHSNVHLQFIVPTNDNRWPPGTWGCALGSKVNQLRVHNHKLDRYKLEFLSQVEFSFDVSETKWTELILPSLKTYFKVYGDCRVPFDFFVPSTDPWPCSTRGYHLGKAVAHIRNRSFRRQVKRDWKLLEEIGFIWNASDDNWNHVILPALETYAKLCNRYYIQNSFVVPSQEPWPRQTWNLNLGMLAQGIRNGGNYREQMQSSEVQLRELGFWDWLTIGIYNHKTEIGWVPVTLPYENNPADPVDTKWKERVLPSLQVFVQVHGHCFVPNYFVVPDTEPWPKPAWGMKLGNTVNRIRHSGRYKNYIYRDKEEFEKLNFVWNVVESRWKDVILPALRLYKRTYPHHPKIPHYFIVPSASPWPAPAWGWHLGQILNNMKNQKRYQPQIDSYEKELRELGYFDQIRHKGENRRIESKISYDQYI